MTTSRSVDVATGAIVGVLIVAGIAETAAVVAGVVTGYGPRSALALAQPAALLGPTLAVVVASHGGRVARIAALFAAVAALAVRIGGAVLLTRARWAGDMADVVSAVAGCLVGLALVAWALVRVQRNRDLATAQPEPARYPGHELIGVVEPPQSASPGPAVSPSTPVAAPQPASHGQWRTATTPWPRADEDDPHGTLIRPPRR